LLAALTKTAFVAKILMANQLVLQILFARAPNLALAITTAVLMKHAEYGIAVAMDLGAVLSLQLVV
jgi:hypothetical protein